MFLHIFLILFLSIKDCSDGSLDTSMCEVENSSFESEKDTIFRSSPVCATFHESVGLALNSPDRSRINLLSTNTDNTSIISKDLNESCLSCWYTNATSLNSDKLDELRIVCANTEPDILFITETWFNEKSITNLDGYKIFRADRLNKIGGGVCIYTRISKSLNFREVDYKQLKSDIVEQVWCAVDTGLESILLGCIYRPKIIKDNKGMTASKELHKKREEELYNAISFSGNLVRKGKFQGIILTGDFNFNELTWDQYLEPGIIRETEEAVNFLDTLNNSFLIQNVYFQTFQQSYSKLTNLLDLIITETKDRVYELISGCILGDTDKGHLSMTWKYAIKKSKNNIFGENFRKSNYNYKTGNYLGLSNYLNEIKWREIFEDKNVQESYDLFLKEYRKGCEIFLNKILPKIRVNTRPRWLNQELKAMLRVKHGLWMKYLSSGRKSLILYEEYKSQCKLIKSSINKAIYKLEKDLITSAVKNPKKLYSYIKSCQQVDGSIRSLKNCNDCIVTEKYEMAEILNNHFQSVFTKDCNTNTNTPNFQKKTNKILNVDPAELFKVDDIKCRLNKLDCSKSSGRDEVSPHVLKNCLEPISLVLCILFQKSYIESEIPKEWREANVTPLFKKGSRLDSGNYRPVSLTSICCKLMEGIIRDKIMKYLEDSNLISQSQHGFVKNRACVTNLLECEDIVGDCLKRGNTMDVLYTDFSKAFDKVSHTKLLIKLKGYGLGDRLLKWIKAFLWNRRQKVVLGEVESEWGEVTSGVPQGSVLGPALFVIFINDLPECLENICKLYADDGKIFVENEKSNLQNDIYNTANWCDLWSMALNLKKCKIMHYGKSNPLRNYEIMDGYELIKLEKTEFERDLGVIISSNGKTNEQAWAAVSKATRILGLMRKTFRFFNKELFKLLYPTFIRPHLEFASSAWNRMNKSDIKRIESVQRKATGMVLETRSLEYPDRLRELNLTTLELRRKRGDLIQIYKIFNKIDDVNINIGSVTNNRYNTRSHNFQIEKDLFVNCPLRNNSLPNRSATTWNILPYEIVNAKSVNSFKARLDDYIRLGRWRESIYIS